MFSHQKKIELVAPVLSRSQRVKYDDFRDKFTVTFYFNYIHVTESG